MSLRIYLLGQFKLLAGTDTIELSSRPAQSVLAYLALNPGITYRREKLSSLIWPEINNLLTGRLIVVLGAGLGASVLLYLWQQHVESDHGPNGASQNRQPPLSRDQTGPLPVLRHLS